MPLKTSGPFAWLFANRHETTAALSALAREPIAPSEQRRLRRLLAVLELGAASEDAPNDVAAIVNRLSSREFSWLPRNAVGEAIFPHGADRALDAHATRMVLTIARAVHQPSRLGRYFGFIYPLILIILTWAILVLLCFTVVPPFEAIFRDFGLTLPLPTRLLVSLSQLLQSGVWLGAPLILGVGLIGFLVLNRDGRLSAIAEGFGLRQRGNVSDLLAMSRLASELAKAAAANLPLADALRWAAANCGHSRYEQAAAMLAAQAQHGTTSLRHVSSAAVFPANLLEALPASSAAAEHVNIPLLLTLSDLYAERAAVRAENGAAYLGIFTVAVAAGLIGFAALALFLPLITLMTGLA